MITLLSYPRSGRNLLRHMLKCIDIEVYATHRPIIHKEWPLKKHDKLIMLVRDYRECIPRHLYSEKIVSTEMIMKAFGTEFGIRDRACQYIENLVLFDMCRVKKCLIYYEDLINFGKTEFLKVVYFLRNESKHDISKMFHVLNWETESAKALKNYDAPAVSGGEIDFHKKKIEEPGFMEQIMKDANNYIFEKYLTRYENGKS